MSVIDFRYQTSAPPLQSPADRSASSSSIAIESAGVVRAIALLAATILVLGYVRELYVGF